MTHLVFSGDAQKNDEKKIKTYYDNLSGFLRYTVIIRITRSLLS